MIREETEVGIEELNDIISWDYNLMPEGDEDDLTGGEAPIDDDEEVDA